LWRFARIPRDGDPNRRSPQGSMEIPRGGDHFQGSQISPTSAERERERERFLKIPGDPQKETKKTKSSVALLYGSIYIYDNIYVG